MYIYIYSYMYIYSFEATSAINPFNIYSFEATSAINPFKQPKRAFKLKLQNFKIFANYKIFVCLPDHNKRRTV